MRSLVLLCAAPLLLAACSAEVDESVDTSEAALSAAGADPYRWEENPAVVEVDVNPVVRPIGVPRQIVDDPVNLPPGAEMLRPKVIVFSGTTSSPLTPTAHDPCARCTR